MPGRVSQGLTRSGNEDDENDDGGNDANNDDDDDSWWDTSVSNCGGHTLPIKVALMIKDLPTNQNHCTYNIQNTFPLFNIIAPCP